MLYLVATPIGNLEDLSFRALKAIECASYLLCEDTRRTQKLLMRYEMKKPLRSYHKFNQKARLDETIHDLQGGLDIALLSDAGTPTLFDPGSELVQRCQQANLAFTAIPGPASPIVALSLSGFSSTRFQCIGFLPKKKKALQEWLIDALHYPGTTICLESPYRLEKTLTMLSELSPNRPLFVARELTKKFEEKLLGTASELLSAFKGHSIKGEIILLISGEN